MYNIKSVALHTPCRVHRDHSKNKKQKTIRLSVSFNKLDNSLRNARGLSKIDAANVLGIYVIKIPISDNISTM